MSCSDTPIPDTPDPALADVLKRVAAELDRLQGAASVLQDHLGPLLHSAAADATFPAAIQALDPLQQELAALAVFVAALAADAPDTAIGTALDTLNHLSALHDRIAGEPLQAASTDVDLF